ncbi:MAG: deoxyribose-phosphate aldolase [Planctomycetota bacterium]|nr:deoxyribose-phosphate aldolase [Planctomycetota bacterium]MDA1177784.1 deoxyribose-phosphate aldolase [Planctomycetota bacterium]
MEPTTDGITYRSISKMIDHAILTPNLTQEDLERGCQLAIAYDVASVCTMPFYVSECVRLLRGSSVKASTTIGFPHGGHTTSVKCAEADQAVRDGCEELDMVVNISQVLSAQWDYVKKDIDAVVQVAHGSARKVKVIFENCYLQDEHKIRLCEIATELCADWVKTSTGFGPTGATFDDVRLMRQHVPETVQVKAAGGVRDIDTALSMRELGASRCGTSRTQEVLDEWRSRLSLPAVGFARTNSVGY